MNHIMGRILFMRKNKHMDHVVKNAFQRHKLSRVQTSWAHLGQWTTHNRAYAILSRSQITPLSRNPEYPRTLRVDNIFSVYHCYSIHTVKCWKHQSSSTANSLTIAEILYPHATSVFQ